MINVQNIRDNGRGNEELSRFDRTVNGALEHLVVGELEFGGRVTELSATQIVVRTQVLGAKDTTVFRGSESDMRLLVLVAGFHSLTLGDDETRKAIVKQTVANLEALPQGVNRRPFFVANFAPLFMGKTTARIALAAAAGAKDETELAILTSLTTKDLMAVVCLTTQDGTPLVDAVALAT